MEESRGRQKRIPSGDILKGVSGYRRAELLDSIERGEFGGEKSAKQQDTHLSYASLVKGLSKKASSGTTSSSVSSFWAGAGGTVRQGPELYSPLWLTSNTQLPRDRGTMNAWCRIYFALNPIVNNAISLHSTYPIAKLNVSCPDKKIENFFGDMIDDMDLLNVCAQMAQEFFVIGEAFPFLSLDQNSMKWSSCTLQNPDFIYVKRSAVIDEPQISMRPDAELKKLVVSNDPESVRLRAQLPEKLIQNVKNGKNIPLDNFYVSHLARKISPYETRGTSMIAPCIKALMLWDKLRECKYAQADNLINPITLVKLGGSTDMDYKPSASDIENWRTLLEEAQYDKDFKIITHGSVSIERVGAQTVIDVANDIIQLIKEIYIGLMVPQVIMESGDITYANGSLSLDVLKQRYFQFQNMLSKWIRRKVFAPISQLNGFWDYSGGEQKLIIPEVEWNHMSLFDLNDYIATLSGLTEKKTVSIHTTYRSLGLDYEKEKRLLKQEAIDEAISKKEQESLDKMPLATLRSLGVDSEIPETVETALPGESPDEEPLPGQEDASGGGGAPSSPPPV